MGLRNPWRFSFDIDGKIWCGDVGQFLWEEIDVIEKGKNYGWRIMEGDHCFLPPIGCDKRRLELPVAEYGHDEGQSVTGGFVYRGPTVTELQGAYVYTDFVSGRFWALRPDGAGKFRQEKILETNLHVSSFGVDDKRELYACSFDGKIYRFRNSSPVS